VVYGSIRDARKQAPVAQASIEVSWIDLVNLGTKEARNISQRRWKNEAQGDAQGSYAVCGVPDQDTPAGARQLPAQCHRTH
jgi:hypothetical protein